MQKFIFSSQSSASRVEQYQRERKAVYSGSAEGMQQVRLFSEVKKIYQRSTERVCNPCPTQSPSGATFHLSPFKFDA